MWDSLYKLGEIPIHSDFCYLPANFYKALYLMPAFKTTQSFLQVVMQLFTFLVGWASRVQTPECQSLGRFCLFSLIFWNGAMLMVILVKVFNGLGPVFPNSPLISFSNTVLREYSSNAYVGLRRPYQIILIYIKFDGLGR